ncbi:hypothetical protein ACIA5D_15905 [Actinoplanes sp. NPDC051513]|uniref:hypothetical protein n=1 Tax=Actinoplanes sp. NPDC051513 TaxID=3363908 RepID=UPI0037B83245
MAWAYVACMQPIPYDIALLADLETVRGHRGLLRATVPEVPARQPRTERESRFSWTHTATPKALGIVGGFWPVLRQGWAFLDDDPGESLVTPGLAELATELTPARFTTFPRAAGERLAEIFQLTNRHR